MLLLLALFLFCFPNWVEIEKTMGGGGETINSKTKLGQKVTIKVWLKENLQICLTDKLAAINLPAKSAFLKIGGVQHPPYPPRSFAPDYLGT